MFYCFFNTGIIVAIIISENIVELYWNYKDSLRIMEPDSS